MSSWPPASVENEDAAAEPMSARLGAHQLTIPADYDMGELWMTSQSHHTLNLSQLMM